MRGTTKKYRGFISYSQTDKAVAVKLHRQLEGYRLPSRLAGADAASHKVGRFFRDEDEMGAATDLGAALRGAIADSDSLIVICSRASAKSHWVNEEVLHFKRTGRADRIFAIVVDGVPGFADEDKRCFPPALLYELNPDGSLSDRPSEPLGLDTRKEPPPRLLARLVAGLLDLSFDDLWRREQRRRLVNMARISAGAVALVAVVGIVGVMMARASALSLSRSLTAASQDPSLSVETALRVAMLASRPAFMAPAPAEAELRLRDLLAQSYPPWRRVGVLPHEDLVQEVLFSPSGAHIATRTSNGGVRLWRQGSLELQHELRSPDAGAAVANDIFFSADGASLVSVHQDYGAVIWDAASGRQVRALPHAGYMLTGAYSADGARLITSASSSAADPGTGGVKIWDLQGNLIAHIVEPEGGWVWREVSPGGEIIVAHTRPPFSLNFGFSPQPRVLPATRIYSGVTGRQIGAFPAGGLPSPFMSNDGSRMVFAPANDARPNSLADGRGATVATLSTGDAEFQPLEFSPDGGLLLAKSGSELQVFDARAGRLLTTIQSETGAFSADGANVLVLSSNGTRRAWDARTGRPTEVTSAEFDLAFGEVDRATPVGGRLLTLHGDRARIWNAQTGRLSVELTFAAAIDQQRLLAAARVHDAQDIHIWSASGASEVMRLPDGAGGSGLAFTPNGGALITYDGGMWHAESGVEMEADAACGDLQGSQFSVSPSGDRLLLGCYRAAFLGIQARRSLMLIDASSRRVISTFFDGSEEGAYVGAEFSRDGRRIVGFGSENAVVWDPADGRRLSSVRYNAAIMAPASGLYPELPDTFVAVDPAGRFLVEASNGALALRDLESGEITATLMHGAAVRDVAFSEDSAMIATAAADGTLRVWDRATAREITRITDQTDVQGVAITADGGRIAAGLRDGSVRVWERQTRRLISQARMDALRGIYRVELSADGARTFALAEDNAFILGAETGHVLVVLEYTNVNISPYLRDPAADPAPAVGLSPDWRRVVINRFNENTYVIDIGEAQTPAWRRSARGYFADLVCHRERGRLAGDRRLITEDDARAVPALTNHIGQDVCATRELDDANVSLNVRALLE